MKKRWKIISAVVIALFLLTLAAVPVLAQTTATRDIADPTLAPGESTNVTVTINNAQLQALGLDEDPPAGWAVAEVDNGGGQYNATLIEWFWMQADASTITVVYNLTVPLGTAAGVYPIAGTLVSGEGTVAVGGETEITVDGVPPEATTATRDIADQALASGESTNVTVTINNAQLQALGLDEDPPAGWAVAEVDNGGGQYNATLIEWFWMQADAGTITVVYNLTVPLGTADGVYPIAGTLVSGEGTVAVGGESNITVGVIEWVELEFRGSLDRGERDTLLTPDIPGGATELEITLDATADIDLELYDGTTFVIGWKAIISTSGSTIRTYQGDTFAYSGWAGGDEYITADGPLSRAYTLKVYGYEAGDYVVIVSYMPGPPDETPPQITITAQDATVGAPTTIEVSATDLSGVHMIWFSVYPAEDPEEWPNGEDPLAMLTTFTDEGSLTFTPGWAGTYTVEAGACDELGNCTPETTLVEMTFVVSE